MADRYELRIQSTGSWGFTITGLEPDELNEAVEKIHNATQNPGEFYQITTDSGQATRIYGAHIAGFNYHKEN